MSPSGVGRRARRRVTRGYLVAMRETDGSFHACEHCTAGPQNSARWPLLFVSGEHAGQLLWTCSNCKLAQADRHRAAVVLVETPAAW